MAGLRVGVRAAWPRQSGTALPTRWPDHLRLFDIADDRSRNRCAMLGSSGHDPDADEDAEQHADPDDQVQRHGLFFLYLGYFQRFVLHVVPFAVHSPAPDTFRS